MRYNVLFAFRWRGEVRTFLVTIDENFMPTGADLALEVHWGDSQTVFICFRSTLGARWSLFDFAHHRDILLNALCFASLLPFKRTNHASKESMLSLSAIWSIVVSLLTVSPPPCLVCSTRTVTSNRRTMTRGKKNPLRLWAITRVIKLRLTPLIRVVPLLNSLRVTVGVVPAVAGWMEWSRTRDLSLPRKRISALLRNHRQRHHRNVITHG